MKQGLTLCLLLLGSPLLLAQETGRLFHTPAERAQLDIEKYYGGGQQVRQAPQYQGIVRRSQGPATLWVNGAPQEGQAPTDLQVGSAPSAGAPREELLRGGRITVHPPRDAPRP